MALFFIYQIIIIALLFFLFFNYMDFYLTLFPDNWLLITFFSYVSLLFTAIIIPAFFHRIGRLLMSNEGSTESMNNRDRFLWGINSTLFDSTFWIVSKLLPIGMFPHVIYRLFGLKYGKGVGIFARLWDVDLIEIGDYTIIGTDSITTAHIMLADGRVYRDNIKIGHHSSVGLNAIVLPGVTIGDYCVVAPNSVVPRRSVLDSYSIYSGNPVNKVKDLREKYGIITSEKEDGEDGN